MRTVEILFAEGPAVPGFFMKNGGLSQEKVRHYTSRTAAFAFTFSSTLNAIEKLVCARESLSAQSTAKAESNQAAARGCKKDNWDLRKSNLTELPILLYFIEIGLTSS